MLQYSFESFSFALRHRRSWQSSNPSCRHPNLSIVVLLSKHTLIFAALHPGLDKLSVPSNYLQLSRERRSPHYPHAPGARPPLVGCGGVLGLFVVDGPDDLRHPVGISLAIAAKFLQDQCIAILGGRAEPDSDRSACVS